MIYAYGITVQGPYHVKNNIVCQDAHNIIKKDNDIVVAAVADGLGSVKYSDVASKIAAKTSTAYCAEKITKDNTTDEILKLIKESYLLAYDEIERVAKENNHDIDDYDTTLSLSVLIGQDLYYGHAGDSGIIALTSEGLFVKVTEQQRDEDNNVFPLYFKDKWIFKKFDQKICSVFLATDGMYEIMFPYLLKDEEVKIHVGLAQFFMDNQRLQIEINGEDKVRSEVEEFVTNIADAQVNDDKTVVVLINASVESKLQHEDYYKEPDWTALKKKKDEEFRRLAYPHLFKEKSVDIKDENKDVSDPQDTTAAEAEANVTTSEKDETKKTEASDAIATTTNQTVPNTQSTPQVVSTQPEQKKGGLWGKIFGSKK